MGALAFYALLQLLWPAPPGVLVQGMVVGGLTALIAFGISLIYRANRIVNFAQGDLGAAPAAFAVLLIVGPGWPFPLAVLAGIVAAVALGALLERLVIRRFFRAPRLILTVATIGLAQILAGGRPPRARASNEILYQPMWLLFTGIHMAGPDLSPATFRDGLFRYPPSGGGRRTVLQRSFGRHGLWPWDNYTAFDDVTEVWWDPGAAGEDEIGNRAQGMYRFVEDGRRYRPGEWPASEPRVFDPSIARTHFDELPESDRYPTYER